MSLHFRLLTVWIAASTVLDQTQGGAGAVASIMASTGSEIASAAKEVQSHFFILSSFISRIPLVGTSQETSMST